MSSAEQVGLDHVERLVGPEPFEPVVLDLGVAGVEPLTQAASAGGDRRPALLQHPLRMWRVQSSGALRRRAGLGRRTDELRLLDQRTALGGDPPDPASGVVAAGVAEVDLAVLDDRVVPVGDVDRPVGAHLDVDRSEGGVAGLDQLGQLAAAKPAPSSLRTNRRTLLARKSLVSMLPCHVSGRCRPLRISAPQYLGLPGLRPARMRSASGRGDVIGPGEDVVDPLAAGAVGGERLAPAVEVVAPGIDQPRAKTSSRIVSGRNCQIPPPPSRRTPSGVSMWLWI